MTQAIRLTIYECLGKLSPRLFGRASYYHNSTLAQPCVQDFIDRLHHRLQETLPCICSDTTLMFGMLGFRLLCLLHSTHLSCQLSQTPLLARNVTQVLNTRLDSDRFPIKSDLLRLGNGIVIFNMSTGGKHLMHTALSFILFITFPD
jgi:hypothetical protein